MQNQFVTLSEQASDRTLQRSRGAVFHFVSFSGSCVANMNIPPAHHLNHLGVHPPSTISLSLPKPPQPIFALQFARKCVAPLPLLLGVFRLAIGSQMHASKICNMTAHWRPDVHTCIYTRDSGATGIFTLQMCAVYFVIPLDNYWYFSFASNHFQNPRIIQCQTVQ